MENLVHYLYRYIHRQYLLRLFQRNHRLLPCPTIVNVENVLEDLSRQNITIIPDEVDEIEVNQFRRDAEYEFYYPNYYSNRELVRLKKIREHYIAARLLNLTNSDIYIDLASQFSPAPQVYEHLYGCKVLRQDYEYPYGIHGRVMGGSAGAIPLPDNSITKGAMHCSLEHFEGDEDIALFHELERILIPNGLFVIVPLYLSNNYFIMTDPRQYIDLPRNNWPIFDPEAIMYKSNGGNRHEKYYDVEHFTKRIMKKTRLKLTVHSFGVDSSYSLGQMRFAAVFEKQAD